MHHFACRSPTPILMLFSDADFPTPKFNRNNSRQHRSGRRRSRNNHRKNNHRDHGSKSKKLDGLFTSTPYGTDDISITIRRRAKEILEYAETKSKAAWNELRSSVLVTTDGGKGTTVIVRRSAVVMLGRSVLLIALAVVTFGLMSKLLSKLRMRGSKPKTIVRRDRSLGGKEVLVGYADNNNPRPLKEYSESSRMETETYGKAAKAGIVDLQHESRRRMIRPLPSWWKPPDRTHLRPVSEQERRQAVLQLESIKKVILDKTLRRIDFAKEEIIQLHKICNTFGLSVSFEDASARDALFRAAVNLVLAECSSHQTGPSFLDAGDTDATQYLAGFAENIRVKADHAVLMINAAIAKLTHSSFLHSWALTVQGKDEEAQRFLSRLSQIYSVFPQDSSPEMRMVAGGLKSHLTLDARRQLLKMYYKACPHHRSVVLEALGLS